MFTKKKISSTLTSLLIYSTLTNADEAQLAKDVANPIANLISVPLQLNYDENINSAQSGDRWVLNIQPVIPISINEEWNLISRTILPVVWQNNLTPTSGFQRGVGDTVQSLFFSPKKPTENGWIWGAGPVFLLPTANDKLLGSEKWGVGPTAVALKQSNGWTYGILANHIWSFAGDDQRSDVSTTFAQPFLTYIFPTYTSLILNTESTYDWEKSQWSVPINTGVNQILKIGGQPISIYAGVRYWADTPDNGPQEWGFRTTLSFLFPK